MEGGAGKSAAIGGNQQVGMVKIRGNLRHLPQLDRPLRQIAGLVLKYLLIELVKVLSWVESVADHNMPSI